MAGRFSALLQRANPMRYMQNLNSLNPKLKLPSYSAGSPNLEVAKVCLRSLATTTYPPRVSHGRIATFKFLHVRQDLTN